MSQTNKDRVADFYAGVLSGDIDALESMITADFRVVEADSLPYAGVYDGMADLRDLLARVAAHWGGGISAEVEAIIADGDWVVALALMKGVRASTAEPVVVPLCEVWKFRGERICEVRPFYFDQAKVCLIRQ